MSSTRSLLINMTTTGGAYLALAGLVALFVAAGCSESHHSGDQGLIAPVPAGADGGEGEWMTPPTLDGLQSALALREDQLPAMEVALAAWQAARAERGQIDRTGHQGQRGGRRGEHGGQRDGYGDPHGGHGDPRGGGSDAPAVLRPAMVFIETCADILDQDQLIELLGFLAERREAACDERGDAGFPGHPGRRAGHDGCGGPSGSGDHDREWGQMGQHLDEMIALLELTAEQEEAVRALFAEFRAQMQDFRKEHRGEEPRAEWREEMRAKREELHARLSEILTPEQLAVLAEQRTQRHAERKEKRAERHEMRAEFHLEFLTKVLDLTTAQVADIRALHEELRSKVAVVHQQVRDGVLNREEAGLAIEVLHEETLAAMRGILTDEQWPIFEALHELRAGAHEARR